MLFEMFRKSFAANCIIFIVKYIFFEPAAQTRLPCNLVKGPYFRNWVTAPSGPCLASTTGFEPTNHIQVFVSHDTLEFQFRAFLLGIFPISLIHWSIFFFKYHKSLSWLVCSGKLGISRANFGLDRIYYIPINLL